MGVCSKIVEKAGSWWTWIGWGLLVWSFAIPYFSDAGPAVCMFFILLTLAWWLIDATDRSAPAWMIVCGVLMMVFRFLPYGGIVVIGCWALYWTRFRE